MLIALLAILGVDLIVIVALVAGLLLRRRWLGRHGAYPSRIRVVEGQAEGLKAKWKPGRARWVRDVLVFSPGPLLLASRILPVDGFDGEPRGAAGDEGKRLDDDAVVRRLVTESGVVELATAATAALPVLGAASAAN